MVTGFLCLQLEVANMRGVQSGFWLAHLEGIPLTTGWLALAIALYILAGACWLPALYATYARWWFILGWPAFLGVIGISTSWS